MTKKLLTLINVQMIMLVKNIEHQNDYSYWLITWLAQVVAFKWYLIPIVLFFMFMGEDWKQFTHQKNSQNEGNTISIPWVWLLEGVKLNNHKKIQCI
jgi:hypothetical protein